MRANRLFRALYGALLTGLFAGGCGGSQFDGRVYQGDNLSFRLGTVPKEWRKVDAEGALLVFRDDSSLASVAVNGRCGKDGDDVPLVSLTHHLFLQFTDRDVKSQRAFQLDGREALQTEIDAKLDGVPKHFDVVVLKKNGCVYDFIQVADPPVNAESQQRFLAFVQGFSTISP
jgi:hypothetical protein